MSAQQLLARMLAALREAGIPSMLTGSYAAAYHGQARATQDIDLVIDPTADALRRFVRNLLPTEYYVSEEAALMALEQESLFNVIDLATGWKVDFIIRKSRPFNIEEFSRRRGLAADGMEIDVATPEDLVIAKLEWARQGGSARQLEDVARLLAARGDAIDRAYIERWVAALGLGHEWAQATKTTLSDLLRELDADRSDRF